MENNENQNVSDAQGDQPAAVSTQEQKDAQVSRKAYEDIQRDMHKYKQKMKDANAALNEREAQLKIIEEQKLADEKRYEELYTNTKREKEELEARVAAEHESNVRSKKLFALNQELGGKVKDQYLSLANLDSIEVLDDGSLSSESIREAANMFRQEHSVLIPQADNANITSQAPGDGSMAPREKSINEMSFEEKKQALIELNLKNRS